MPRKNKSKKSNKVLKEKISQNENLVRALIVSPEYDEKRDVFVWKTRFIDIGCERILIWRVNDLFNALNINISLLDQNPEKKKELLHKFCKDIKGKTINIKLESIKNISIMEKNEDSESYVESVKNSLSVYDELPFEEAKAIEAEKAGVKYDDVALRIRELQSM